jgi:hypothetical protein
LPSQVDVLAFRGIIFVIIQGGRVKISMFFSKHKFVDGGRKLRAKKLPDIVGISPKDGQDIRTISRIELAEVLKRERILIKAYSEKKKMGPSFVSKARKVSKSEYQAVVHLQLEETEQIKPLEVDIKKVYQMVDGGKIQDGMALAGLALARKYLI